MNLLTSRKKDRDRIRRVREILKSILFGATFFDMTQDALRMKWYTEQSLMLVSIGDMLGLPMVSYYRLRLLPYWIHKITIWGFLKRPPGLSLEICSRRDHASFQKQRAGLTLTETALSGEELEALFRVSSSDRARADGIILNEELQDRLRRAKSFLRYLLIDNRESRVYLTGKLTSESVAPLLDLVLLSGKMVS